MAQQILIVGGGAAGYFLAANLPQSKKYEVTLIEKGKQPLQKVKISGGGRCNLTHAEFNPKELVKNYPRGQKELLSVFSRFQPGDTFEWFNNKGVELHTEEDGRVFPASNSSQTIIDTLVNETQKNKVNIRLEERLISIKKNEENFLEETSKK